MVRKHLRLPLSTAINSGSEVADISQITAKRYIDRLWSDAGIFKRDFDNELDEYVIVPRNPEFFGTSAESLDEAV